MPSCVLPQDVIEAFLRPKVDYGEYTWRVLSECGSKQLPMTGPLTHRACYIAVPLYICGFVVLGEALRKRDSVGALVMGWGIAEVAIMVNTVAVCASLYVHATREDLRVYLP